MHNTHYIILNATDSETANYEVERMLCEWGTENNWFDIERITDLDNLTEEDKKYLNGELESLNRELSCYQLQRIKDAIKNLQERTEEGRHIYWQLLECYNSLYHLSAHVKDNDVNYTIEDLKEIDDYFGYSYDEYGITNMYDSSNKDSNVFFVQIDMHS